MGVERHSEIDGRTTRHPGYEISQRIRKRIEEVFGWKKSAAGTRQTKFRGGRTGRLELCPDRRCLQSDPVTEVVPHKPP